MEVGMVRSSISFPFLVSALFSLPLSAGPVIQFDTTTFNCGTVIEGKTDKLNATFIVKNTGDAVLKIEKVRPGCGCTVVKYDSLINPGKTAKIESQVRIKGYHAGPLSKSIAVTSNASNTPNVRLYITAIIRSVVDIQERFISFNGNDTAAKKLAVLSKKKDLNVSDVSFRANTDRNRKADGAWQADTPLPVKFSWAPTDSTAADGFRVFNLTLSRPGIDTSCTGNFIIATNHPEIPKLTVAGALQKQ